MKKSAQMIFAAIAGLALLLPSATAEARGLAYRPASMGALLKSRPHHRSMMSGQRRRNRGGIRPTVIHFHPVRPRVMRLQPQHFSGGMRLAPGLGSGAGTSHRAARVQGLSSIPRGHGNGL